MKLNKGAIHKLLSEKYTVIVLFKPENPEFTLHAFITNSFKDDVVLNKYIVTGYDVTEIMENFDVLNLVTTSQIDTKIQSLPILTMEFSKDFSFIRYLSYVKQ